MVRFLFIFRILDEQNELPDGKPEDKNVCLHMPCFFLVQPLRACFKNLRFVVLSQFLQSGGRVSKV